MSNVGYEEKKMTLNIIRFAVLDFVVLGTHIDKNITKNRKQYIDIATFHC